MVNEETLTVTNIGFLTNLSAGPLNESNQTWTFTTTTVTNNSTNAAFSALPAVDTNGTLSFNLDAHSFGTNEITVVMTDSGGTSNGGVNAYTNSFLLAVAQTNHAPGIVPTNLTVLENANSGLTATVIVWDYDQATNFTFAATSLNSSLATVSVTATNVLGTSNVSYTLTFALATNSSGTATIQLTPRKASSRPPTPIPRDRHPGQPAAQLRLHHQRHDQRCPGGGRKCRLDHR